MKKFIDYIVVGVVVVTCGVLGYNIMKSSFDAYQIYYKENYPEIDPTDGATLLGIDAEFDRGVRYYKNNKAKPVREDFVVMGTWKEAKADGEVFEHPLNPKTKLYDVTYSDFFSSEGGNITISYQGFTDTLYAPLIDIQLERLEVEHGPYRYKYQAGEFFDKTGIKAYAVYNDGSKELLDNKDIIIDNNHALTTQDKQVILAYSDGEFTKSASVDVQVKKDFKDGKVIKIGLGNSNGVIRHGQVIERAEMDVCVTYESGNKKLLTPYDYIINNKAMHAYLGVQNYADITYKDDKNVTGRIPLTVTSRIEGENGYIIGGTRKKEIEYIANKDGSIVETDHELIFGGDFGKTVTNGGEAYAAYIYFATAPSNVDITVRCGNSNLFKVDDNWYMRPLQINTIMDLYVNDEKVNIDDNVVLAGCGPANDDAPLYNVYSTITFKDVLFDVGNNKVTFKFKKSTIGELTFYDETPSTINIDYVDVVTNGIDVPDDITFKQVYFSSSFRVKFGDNFDTLDLPIYGIYGTENRKIVITDKFAKITKPSGYATIGDHTIYVDFYHDKAHSFEKTFTVGDLILEAENATKKGTSEMVNTTEAEYILDKVSNKYNKGDEVTAVKGMDYSATNHGVFGETSLTFTFNAAPGSHRLFVKASNTNFFIGGNNKAYTKEIDMNQVIDIYLNGEKINYSAILPSVTDAEHHDWCWMGFFMLDVGLLDLQAGANTIKLQAKTGGSVPKNYWEEYAIPRFDYIKITNP